MSTITQRKKLSKGSWALIIILLVAVISVAALAVVGYIDLSFIANWITSTMSFGASGWINGVIVLLTPFICGMLFLYVTINYFVGQKVTTAGTSAQGYAPTPSYPSQPASSGKETTIS
jgi:hypothetical protein